MSPMNECIDSKAFAALILDYEWKANDLLPAQVSCRVLIDGTFKARLSAATREDAIEKFRNGDY